MCYEAATNALWIVCKAQDSDERARHVYAFDIASERVSHLFAIQFDDIEAVYGQPFKKFNPSGIAIHPITHQIYVIATSGQLLVVLNSVTFDVASVHHLDRETFLMPEGDMHARVFLSHDRFRSHCWNSHNQIGITFDDCGNLWIACEGRGREGGPGYGTGTTAHGPRCTHALSHPLFQSVFLVLKFPFRPH